MLDIKWIQVNTSKEVTKFKYIKNLNISRYKITCMPHICIMREPKSRCSAEAEIEFSQRCSFSFMLKYDCRIF